MTILRLFAFTSIIALTACGSDTQLQVENDGNPVITVENHAAMLREIVKVANDETLDAASAGLDPAFNLIEGLIDQANLNGAAAGNGLVFSLKESTDENGYVSNYTFTCDSGGTIVALAYTYPQTDGRSIVEQISAEGACSIDDAAYEGVAYKLVRFVRAPDVSNFNNFTVSYANSDSLMLHGDYENTSPENRGPTVNIGWTNANLRTVINGELTTVNGYNSNRRSVVPSVVPDSAPPSAVAEVAFTVSAPWTAGEPVEVTINLNYQADGELQANEDGSYPAQWQGGTVRVVAADGSGFTLSPNTDDSETFSVLFDGESAEMVTHFWADGYQIVCAFGFDCAAPIIM